MMQDSNWRKALWIADELNEDAEDVYDALIGNITKPKEFVDAVKNCESRYDNEKERGLR